LIDANEGKITFVTPKILPKAPNIQRLAKSKK